jgi:tRNA A37 threonylcarbamoyladenosine dehydratase/predicted adenine nucleotide alpha hydrolase (AANH) superfamily ATPase
MRLLFHCCCGPCATACVENIATDGITPTLFWYNPNIHPLAEYHNRRDAFIAFAAAKNLKTEMPGSNDEYGEQAFLSGIGGETEAPGRCELCYRMRLEQTASYAAEKGFDAFSTSLLISPYQQHELIRRVGEEAAARYGVEFLYRDFRPLYGQSRKQARALGLYMQKYCGCLFSNNHSSNLTTEYTEEHGGLSHQKLRETPWLNNSGITVNPLFQRLALITGAEILKKLEQTSVLIVGIGGVGSWCAEALVRSGVGKIGLVDSDIVCITNINRQTQATSRTVGNVKVEALQQRLLEINPHCEVTAWQKVFSRENAAEFGIEKADYVIDAIDSLAHKLDLIETASAAGVKFFSSMGMAQKLDPTRLKTADIWETHGCPLARLIRQGLRKRGFTGSFTVVYSDESLERHKDIAISCGSDNCLCNGEWCGGKKVINGSAVTVTAPAGMALASLVLRDVMGHK